MVVKSSGAFTLVELISVIAIAGILAATATVSLLPSVTMQLQSSRDQVLTAFFLAQQEAMSQPLDVRLSITGGNQIDIREDSDSDGDFADESSLTLGGVAYPISLQPNQSITNTNFDFDRLGQTTAATLTLSQGSDSVSIRVSGTGYAY